MTNIKLLHEGIQVKTDEPNEQLVSTLSDLLRLAESGSLQSCIGTGFDSQQTRITAWCDFHDNKYEMLGAIEFLKTEWLDKNVPFDDGDDED